MNPVLREGNSDRRAPASVKKYARAHPHRMGAWTADSKTNVAHMDADDFRSTEKSVGDRRGRLAAHRAGRRRRHHHRPARVGARCWRARSSTRSVMRVAALREFLTAQIARAKAEGVLFSVHLKATMMKVSDPIIFGHVVRAFFPKTFAAVRRGARRGRPDPERRPRRHPQGPGVAARGRRDQGVLRRRARRGPGAGDGRLRPAASPTCTCRATSSSTPRCRR